MDWSCRSSCCVMDQLHRINLRKAKATGHSGLLFVYHMFKPGMKLHGQKYLDTWASRRKGNNSTGIYLLLLQHLSFHKILLTSLELRGSLSLLLLLLSLSLLLLLYCCCCIGSKWVTVDFISLCLGVNLVTGEGWGGGCRVSKDISVFFSRVMQIMIHLTSCNAA